MQPLLIIPVETFTPPYWETSFLADLGVSIIARCATWRYHASALAPQLPGPRLKTGVSLLFCCFSPRRPLSALILHKKSRSGLFDNFHLVSGPWSPVR
jgi:hypothetical protein